MLILKGTRFAKFATSKNDGGGPWWTGIHCHLGYDMPMKNFVGANPTPILNEFKKVNSVNYSLHFGQAFGNLYKPGQHTAIDWYTNGCVPLVAPFDMEVTPYSVYLYSGDTIKTSYLKCVRCSDGKTFYLEHMKMNCSSPYKPVKFTGALKRYKSQNLKDIAGEVNKGWQGYVLRLNTTWYEFRWRNGTKQYMTSKDVNGDRCWPDKF